MLGDSRLSAGVLTEVVMLANGIMTVYVLLSFLGRPCEEPALLLCEKRLDVVYHMTYVGVQHDCNMSSVYRGHYANNMKATRKIAGAILSQQKRLGDLPPWISWYWMKTSTRKLNSMSPSLLRDRYSTYQIPSCAIGSLIPHEHSTDRASNPT